MYIICNKQKKYTEISPEKEGKGDDDDEEKKTRIASLLCDSDCFKSIKSVFVKYALI